MQSMGLSSYEPQFNVYLAESRGLVYIDTYCGNEARRRFSAVRLLTACGVLLLFFENDGSMFVQGLLPPTIVRNYCLCAPTSHPGSIICHLHLATEASWGGHPIPTFSVY